MRDWDDAMRCALAYHGILARARAPDFQRGHREVSRRPMCTKEVVERCFTVPLISAIIPLPLRWASILPEKKLGMFSTPTGGFGARPARAARAARAPEKNQDWGEGCKN